MNLILNDILVKDRTQGKASWLPNLENNLPDCINPELFSISLIYHLSLLYGYDNDGFYLQSRSMRVFIIFTYLHDKYFCKDIFSLLIKKNL